MIQANGVIDLMKPFAGPDSVATLVAGLEVRGLVQTEDGRLSLLPEGRELHSRCLEQQQAFRQSVMTDIAGQDYATAVLVLQKIVANTERNG